MTISIPVVIHEWLGKLLGPEPKFKKGDSVQCTSGDELMVVQWVKVLHNTHIIYLCRWYDSQARSNRTNIFKEDKLVHFDWYGSKAQSKAADQQGY
jgi:uncharacterized protein YodC (DUF2158 family)